MIFRLGRTITELSWALVPVIDTLELISVSDMFLAFFVDSNRFKLDVLGFVLGEEINFFTDFFLEVLSINNPAP